MARMQLSFSNEDIAELLAEYARTKLGMSIDAHEFDCTDIEGERMRVQFVVAWDPVDPEAPADQRAHVGAE